MALFRCERCQEMVEEADVRRRARKPDEEPSLLPDEPDRFKIRIALELQMDTDRIGPETREVLYHIRFVTRGAGSGRCGSHRSQIACGPLREPTPTEISAHDEESRWKAMFANAKAVR